MKSELTGARVKLVIVEPWDLVTANGSGPFFAHVLQVSGSALLLALEQSFKDKSQPYKYFIATTRREGTTPEEMRSGTQIGFNLTGIPDERATSGNPFDLSWWRGGTCAIADVTFA